MAYPQFFHHGLSYTESMGPWGPREWCPKSSRAPLVSSRGTEASDGPAISTSDMARKAQRGGLRDHADHVDRRKSGDWIIKDRDDDDQLVVSFQPRKIWKSNGLIVPNWKNKKCSKPPTRWDKVEIAGDVQKMKELENMVWGIWVSHAQTQTWQTVLDPSSSFVEPKRFVEEFPQPIPPKKGN